MSSSSPPSAAPSQNPAPPGPANLSSLTFEATFTTNLPADKETRNFPRAVKQTSFSLVSPTPPPEDDQRQKWRLETEGGDAPSQLPRALIAWSRSAAALLDLYPATPSGDERENAIDVLGGFGPQWPGMVPYAQCYSGHQFGSFAGQLGDGRAITLGEFVNASGQRWELQLKGAGKTPYSRTADGRAVLRSSVREFLCSEAMHALGVPTTRALSLVSTGAGVVRDMFYSGDPKFESGAVCSRMAPTFLRVGSFENPASAGEIERLQATADYAIEHHFPHLADMSGDVVSMVRNKYGALLAEAVRRNAEMVALWQGVGFVHGVLNSDNTSILGLTIDYGPYGFLDAYDPKYTPNTTDMPGGRYRYEMQPMAINWNLTILGRSFIPLCGLVEAQEIIKSFDNIYETAYNALFSKKLGLSEWKKEADGELLAALFDLMEAGKTDFTNTFRSLSSVKASSTDDELDVVYAPLVAGKKDVDADLWAAWMRRYRERVAADSGMSDAERVKVMNGTNPVFILRNYMAQEAIDAANKGDFSLVNDLHDLLCNPYETNEKFERYTQEPPAWAARPGVCVNSCSS